MKERLYQSIADVFDPKKYDPDWEVRQPQLAANKSQGRKGAEFVGYSNEIKFNGQAPFNLDAMKLEDRLKTFEAFLQPNQPYQAFVPKLCLKQFFAEVMRGNAPLSAYKGVSYNPNLITDGEKLDNVDFFAWAKKVQEKVPDFELTILDASPYQVINQIKDLTIPKDLPDAEFANWFYGIIDQGVENDPQIKENCRLRGLYLRALLGATGVKGNVVSALDIIKRRDPALLRAFEEARQLCGMAKSKSGLLKVNRFVSYRRYGQEFAKTYTPAVVAEALYFMEQNGIKAKLGPTSEVAFDSIIADVMKEKSPYNFFWYSRPFEKKGSNRGGIYVQDQPDIIAQKLRSNTAYGKWMNEVLDPFSKEEGVMDKVLDVNERIRKILTSL